mmetsp:Transcript_19455/g.35650  ORF Transcript_19455/g.35650 Transcript_19455/m.35650 type:complete len:91 (-) Transcript_19455:57-329(-)
MMPWAPLPSKCAEASREMISQSLALETFEGGAQCQHVKAICIDRHFGLLHRLLSRSMRCCSSPFLFGAYIQHDISNMLLLMLAFCPYATW